ncbi:MAG: hypothetical protein OIF50_03255 [Flavobacteriaceae bacterium]|nr:hypothetical protein [Flavobacteriaceae bacterium]
MRIFKKKRNSSSNIIVESHTNQIKINGREVSFPIDYDTLVEIFGKPSREEHDVVWQVIWDKLGIYTEYATSDAIFYIRFLLSNKHQLKYFPKKFFCGQIKVDNQEVTQENFKEIKLKKYEVSKNTYEGEAQPYTISIGLNFFYTVDVPKDKYVIKQPKEDVLEFKDFGFKLSIIQELMYNQELLEPKFDLYEFVDWYSKRSINLEEEGYEPIPEVTQYFKDLQIPKKLASEITQIYQDGGNQVYMQLLRFGEGGEDYWDIENTADAKQFPNLKKAVLCYAKENVIDELNNMGIQAEWL